MCSLTFYAWHHLKLVDAFTGIWKEKFKNSCPQNPSFSSSKGRPSRAEVSSGAACEQVSLWAGCGFGSCQHQGWILGMGSCQPCPGCPGALGVAAAQPGSPRAPHTLTGWLLLEAALAGLKSSSKRAFEVCSGFSAIAKPGMGCGSWS